MSSYLSDPSAWILKCSRILIVLIFCQTFETISHPSFPELDIIFSFPYYPQITNAVILRTHSTCPLCSRRPPLADDTKAGGGGCRWRGRAPPCPPEVVSGAAAGAGGAGWHTAARWSGREACQLIPDTMGRPRPSAGQPSRRFVRAL